MPRVVRKLEREGLRAVLTRVARVPSCIKRGGKRGHCASCTCRRLFFGVVSGMDRRGDDEVRPMRSFSKCWQ